jgi:hypothetical protein
MSCTQLSNFGWNDRRVDSDDARIESVSPDDPAWDDGLRWQNRETVIARKAPDLIRNWTDQGRAFGDEFSVTEVHRHHRDSSEKRRFRIDR